MKKFVLGLSVLALTLCSVTVNAQTKAYWRFEDGVADTDVIHTGGAGVYNGDVVDVSGNGNDLSVWETGGGGGYGYKASSSLGIIPSIGKANNLSVRNTGGGPAMFCATTDMATWSPTAFTVEVVCKLENGGWKTIIGRDSRDTFTGNMELAAFYLQVTPGNGFAFKYCDAAGNFHDATSADGLLQGYDWGTDPDGNQAPWTALAAVCDGTTMSLYMNVIGSGTGYQLIAELDVSDSTDTRISTGAGDGGDWDAGNWTVGRGLYNGGHGDRAYGFIDEVRFSDGALSVSDFLMEPLTNTPVVDQASDLVNGDVDVTLNWKAAAKNGVVVSKIADQYVFLSNTTSVDPNMYYIGSAGDPGSVEAATFGPINLDFDSTYNWLVVDAYVGEEVTLDPWVSVLADLDPNNFVGPKWSFDTIASVPVITTNPTGGLVSVGDSFEMSVVVDSITPAVYTWYKSADNVISEDDTVVGTNSNVLNLTGIAVADMAYYYCAVNNDSAQVVNSGLALLEVRSMVAEYTFDDTLVDTVSGNAGLGVIGETTGATMNYAAGKIGNALSLNGVDEYVQIACPARNSYTIELLVKTTAVANGGDWWNGIGLVDGEMPGGVRDFGTVLSGSVFAMGSGPSGTTIRSTKAINDGQWHYCVAIREVTTGTMSVYVDGQLEATIADRDTNVTQTATDYLTVGKIRTGNAFLNGMIDEVKIYNYAIGEMEVAQKFHAIDPEADICIQSQKPEAKYDLNQDCIVDINDFAMMAANWMDCAIYPTCF